MTGRCLHGRFACCCFLPGLPAYPHECIGTERQPFRSICDPGKRRAGDPRDLVGQPACKSGHLCRHACEHGDLAIANETGFPSLASAHKTIRRSERGWRARVLRLSRRVVARLRCELGVYGAPETFLLDAGGTIRYKRVGDVNEDIWREELQPAIAALEALR